MRHIFLLFCLCLSSLFLIQSSENNSPQESLEKIAAFKSLCVLALPSEPDVVHLMELSDRIYHCVATTPTINNTYHEFAYTDRLMSTIAREFIKTDNPLFACNKAYGHMITTLKNKDQQEKVWYKAPSSEHITINAFSHAYIFGAFFHKTPRVAADLAAHYSLLFSSAPSAKAACAVIAYVTAQSIEHHHAQAPDKMKDIFNVIPSIAGHHDEQTKNTINEWYGNYLPSNQLPHLSEDATPNQALITILHLFLQSQHAANLDDLLLLVKEPKNLTLGYTTAALIGAYYGDSMIPKNKLFLETKQIHTPQNNRIHIRPRKHSIYVAYILVVFFLLLIKELPYHLY